MVVDKELEERVRVYKVTHVSDKYCSLIHKHGMCFAQAQLLLAIHHTPIKFGLLKNNI